MQQVTPKAAAVDNDGHGGVVGLKGQHVGEEGNHAQVAGDGEDVDRGGGFFADIDALVANVVADGECCCDADPARKQQTRVPEPAAEGEGSEGEVGVDDVDGEESDNGGLGGIVDEPPRH